MFKVNDGDDDDDSSNNNDFITIVVHPPGGSLSTNYKSAEMKHWFLRRRET